MARTDDAPLPEPPARPAEEPPPGEASAPHDAGPPDGKASHEEQADVPASGEAPPASPSAEADKPTDEQVANEWEQVRPSEKPMGLVGITLDEGVQTSVVGQIYGLDFKIEGKGFTVRVFYDNYNRRLKVLDYEATHYRNMIRRLVWLAKANDFDKIFLKASQRDWQEFLTLGFMLEGIIKYYFHGEDAYVLSRFGSNERVTSHRLIEESELIESLMRAKRAYTPPPLPDDYQMIVASEEHIPGLVALYRRVFKTYPSPLTHPDYVQQTMQSGVIYRAVLNGKGKIVSAASAEIDRKHANAELTDCATNPSERGKGLMYSILRALEQDLRDRGIVCGYTLARARSGGMNRVFYRLGYEYTGRLVNNCDIYGQYEDMNIWVKRLSGWQLDTG